MYTVYDFINSNIEAKHMKFGWKVKVVQNNLSSEIVLHYTMLNFDWKSLEFLNDELWNMFLSSDSYKSMRLKIDKAKEKHKRLYFSAFSIDILKHIVSEADIKVNIDKLIDKAVKRKSEKIKEQLYSFELYKQ